ncbi:hypothetical protein PGH07_05900 [Sulfurovum sp. zt1-1]|uniref:Wadjet protein JetD C-terminal domain-containing protein n=1 Tax=Sulfurovum zhangzhouensis TaxID=3019067 RepID=A0ABT7QZN4_9BACT|nr:hypothetical protein [Sulfurovum zhangzhouensis]MDM5271701.1 hypothetical protein [Sulfurovum zhangzhouensis]
MKHYRGIRKKLTAYIDQFLATGDSVENIRDIWYKFKGEIEYLKNMPDDKWDIYVNRLIGEYLYELFLDGDVTIYSRLNVITKGLSNDTHTYNTPIVLFSEKPTRSTDMLSEALLCGIYSSTGQIPSFESVNIAQYLNRTAKHNRAYLIAITDFDPAGESIFGSLAQKVENDLKLINPDIEFTSIPILFGSGYEDIVSHYPTYTLSGNKRNKLNQAWIDKGQTLGVELNVVENKAELLEAAILKSVAPEVAEELSRHRWKQQKEEEMLASDKRYTQLHEQLKQRIADIREEVESMETVFDAKWSTPIDVDGVKDMTKEK